MEYKYLWVIFIYKCLDNKPKILLLDQSGNYIPILIENVRPNEFSEAMNLFTKMTDIREEDCFPSRFFEYSHRLSLQKGNKKIVIASTSVRLVENYIPSSLLQGGKWFLKDEAIKKINDNKIFLRAFKKEFGGDSFWECLE